MVGPAINKFLDRLNADYNSLHSKYEDLFWISYMGDHSIDRKLNQALKKLDAFRANRQLFAAVQKYQNQLRKEVGFDPGSKLELQKRLAAWTLFFGKYQVPKNLLKIREKIAALETKIHERRAKRKEGYLDPATAKFVPTSELAMSFLTRTNPDEKIRKAAYIAREKMAPDFLPEYIALVKLRNQYARTLGFADFYDFQVQNHEGMGKRELFAIFDRIYAKTKHAFGAIRAMEKTKPGLRKPWNYSFMLSGDFTKQQDPYFQFDTAVLRWGKSFAALGVDFRGGTLTLDLLDRQGKHSNGFCHWPRVVYYKNGKRIPATANFTANAALGQIGVGRHAGNTLFHEGGHAAHLLNADQTEIILNTEYPPSATSWDETQSMFMDTMFSSVEWADRYARDKSGKRYPFALYEKIVAKLHRTNPLDMMGIMLVMDFERRVYAEKNLTAAKVLQFARESSRRHVNYSEDSLIVLNVPHIYDWQSACNYQGYGLAELAVAQWREYFYKKYGYIVDNPAVGREMQKVWQFGAVKTFKQLVKIATGKELDPDAYIQSINAGKQKILARARQRIAALRKVPEFRRKINLNAKIRLVHGKKEIANNSKGFEAMAGAYAKWLRTGPK